jgi:hypothetical protein
MTRTHALRIPGVPALATLVFVLLLGGCTNPFKPADPEPPSGNGIVEDFSSIEALLSTVETAIATRPSGANAYIHAFADSTTPSDRAFRAYHDPAVKAAWLAGSNGQGAPEPWLLGNELGLYSQLSRIRPNDPYLFLFRPDPSSENDTDISPDVRLIHRHYVLKAKPVSSDTVTIVSGFADILVQKANGRYSIFEWRDRVDPQYGVNSVDTKSFTYERLESQ